MSARFPLCIALCLAVLTAALSFGFYARPALAQTPPAAAAADQAAEQTPQGKFIQELGNKAISLLANKALPPEERANQFRQMLFDSFDLQTIGRFVLGRAWLSATPEQREEYMKLFNQLVVKTYSDRFALYAGEGFKVRNIQPEGERDTIVNSDITHPDGSQPTTVSWRVRQKGDQMKIIDVVVEGVSMSVTQRQEYASVIQRNGGDINALLDLMRQRAAEPAAAPAKKG